MIVTDCLEDRYFALYPGEWIAFSDGQIVAHGHDFLEVAQEACRKADDIAIERVPDPNAALWRPADPPAA